ncbi:MAG TPA: H(+)-transporting ATPase [Acholeplasma sp.]|nr:H(+)-transporting ATPase [Acholeplasma sp.]
MKKTISPYLIIIISFLSIILIGTLLLLLPFSTVNNYSLKFDDAFFLATSSVTITGMSSISNLSDTLSLFGKIIVTILIQIGGLSVITISIFIMYLLGSKIGITNRVLLKENINSLNLKGLVSLVKKIILFSFIFELIASIIYLFIFIKIMPLGEAITTSIMHAISSFNNAGFDLMDINQLLINNTYPLLTITTLILVILGGIGFIVIFDIIESKSYKKLTLHSKIVLKVNLFLWFFGFIMFKINSNLTIFQAIFLSITARSAGFGVNLSLLPNHGILVLFVLMLIGASPASTGSGIKTTTVYVLYKSLFSFARGSETVVNKRKISDETKYKAFILLIFMVFMIFISTVYMLIVENITIDIALHEVIAAISNAGLNSGFSSSYNIFSKLMVIILMFVGRVGILTILASFNANWNKPLKSNISYIEEKIIIG